MPRKITMDQLKGRLIKEFDKKLGDESPTKHRCIRILVELKTSNAMIIALLHEKFGVDGPPKVKIADVRWNRNRAREEDGSVLDHDAADTHELTLTGSNLGEAPPAPAPPDSETATTKKKTTKKKTTPDPTPDAPPDPAATTKKKAKTGATKKKTTKKKAVAGEEKDRDIDPNDIDF